MSNNQPPVLLRRQQVSGLFFVDDLAADTVTTIGMQRAVNCIMEFCTEKKLQINVEMTKIAGFKEGGKLSKN